MPRNLHKRWVEIETIDIETVFVGEKARVFSGTAGDVEHGARMWMRAPDHGREFGCLGGVILEL